MISRKEFAKVFNNIHTRFGCWDSPLWELERDATKSKWFVKVKPLSLGPGRVKDMYWEWCNENLSGQLLCYSSDSDNQEEWWGFTEQADVAWWTLKWAR